MEHRAAVRAKGFDGDSRMNDGRRAQLSWRVLYRNPTGARVKAIEGANPTISSVRGAPTCVRASSQIIFSFWRLSVGEGCGPSRQRRRHSSALADLLVQLLAQICGQRSEMILRGYLRSAGDVRDPRSSASSGRLDQPILRGNYGGVRRSSILDREPTNSAYLDFGNSLYPLPPSPPRTSASSRDRPSSLK
ncbi:hypothetical protein ACVIHH_000092 [Bradyrhizobium sp. USDA 4518]